MKDIRPNKFLTYENTLIHIVLHLIRDQQCESLYQNGHIFGLSSIIIIPTLS